MFSTQEMDSLCAGAPDLPPAKTAQIVNRLVRSTPGPLGLHAALGCVWVSSWLSAIGVPDEHHPFLIDQLAPYISELIVRIQESKEQDELPSFQLGILDNQFVVWTYLNPGNEEGVEELFDLETYAELKSIEYPPVTSITCNVTALFIYRLDALNTQGGGNEQSNDTGPGDSTG